MRKTSSISAASAGLTMQRGGQRALALLAAVCLVATTGISADGAHAQTSKRDPRRAAVASAPTVRATKAITNFSQALSCMDDLFLQYGKHDIGIISNDLPDATETLKVGTREMLISALDAMSLKSGAFKYIDASYDASNDGIRNMQQQVQGKNLVANYYIKGGITQVDQGVLSKSKRAGVAFDFLSVGASSDRSVSNVALELGIYRTDDRTQIRGVRTANMMQVVRSGSGVDLGGLIPFASLLFEVSNDRAQGSHQTVRTLIELSLIELTGKFTKVPYWRCLSLPSSDPAAMQAAEEYYSRMKPEEQITAAQTALAAAGLYNGGYEGAMTPALAGAITRYRAQHNLAPGPHVDFDLYFSFLTKGLVADGEGAGHKRRPPALAAKPQHDSLAFELKTRPIVEQGSSMRLELTANKDAYFFCFMAAGAKGAARIYPNRFTGAQPLTPAGTTLVIPAADAPYSVRLNDAGTERIACIARQRPFETLPDLVKMQALKVQEVNNPLGPLEAIINDFQRADPAGLESSVQVQSVQVVRQTAGRQ